MQRLVLRWAFSCEPEDVQRQIKFYHIYQSHILTPSPAHTNMGLVQANPF